uniref:Uncharacterized protein n=1 Tax=Oryza sativa subsp. japonica TaxID=39947 RepID=Q6ZI34_ORYSJ|nr:hypothetical protein [Oryza sativa Japonica Group]
MDAGSATCRRSLLGLARRLLRAAPPAACRVRSCWAREGRRRPLPGWEEEGEEGEERAGMGGGRGGGGEGDGSEERSDGKGGVGWEGRRGRRRPGWEEEEERVMHLRREEAGCWD